MFSAFCALGVAFCRTTPASCGVGCKDPIGTAHYTFAALLFLTLAYFCLVLFKMTASGRAMTRQKQQRNVVYTVCGWVIIASVRSIVVLKFLHVTHLLGDLGSVFVFETTSLIAFGIAWLTKGETFLKD